MSRVMTGEPAGNQVAVVAPGHTAYLSVLGEAVAPTVALTGSGRLTVIRLQMAVREACTNVIEHGRRG